MKYQYISQEIELEIRRNFSARLKNYKILRKWIADAVGQMVEHDPKLYRYTTRVKEISSVLKKIDGKIATEHELIEKGLMAHHQSKWIKAICFDDFESLVDDWVGCRIISYTRDALPDLHKRILKHKGFRVERVTIHESHGHEMFGNIKLRKDRDEYKVNYNGYSGIHYVISPITVDEYFEQEPLIFHKFELQIRTLLQEAWGQVQHEVIYKGRLPDLIKYEKSDRFASLAQFLHACDNELSTLSKNHASNNIDTSSESRYKYKAPLPKSKKPVTKRRQIPIRFTQKSDE